MDTKGEEQRVSALSVDQIQTNLFEGLKGQETHLTNTTELLNKTSADYRANLIAVNDKLIVVAVGSASLFITFLGVIFNSDKNTSTLEYKYFVISIASLLLACLLLLISRWAGSLYIFNTVHKYYLQATKGRTQTQVKILENNPMGIDRDTFEFFSPKDIDKEVSEGRAYLEKIDTQIETDGKKEIFYDRLSLMTMWVAYISLAAGYASALVFFEGIIRIMNGIT